MEALLNRTAIITTVANFELYNRTSNLFPENIRTYVIDGRNGMHGLDSIFYMFKKLEDKGIDWLIMADEDVVFENSESVFSLIEFMKANNYSVCGVRDGGVIKHRNKNPYAINTFFSILNFKKISDFFNAKKISENQYIQINEFSDSLKHLQFEFDKVSLYEPYYCFYFWLRRKGEHFLFLNSRTFTKEDEKISNEVFHPDGTPLLIHTWFARSYGKNEKHTLRINRILDSIDTKSNFKNPVIFKDSLFYFKMKLLKSARKIKIKLS
ncbi:hypothetical protein [Salegentibacter chungangensis]|uniref:Nucleotide-diphospho-sugar transferase domain-containing protein n=1 Tax=Salegentibacter chungangensis TaxID=1335724 RepID=A0ABW3NS45_9FLAO